MAGQSAPIPLTQGAYQARSVIANNQRCVNLYPEANAADAPFPFTFYPLPGLRARWTPPVAGPGRAVYTSSTGEVFVVVGSGVYYISPGYAGTKLGDLTTHATPVSMKDNGRTIVVVDGSANGFLIDITTHAFSPYADPGYLGADRVDFLDNFLVFNQPNSRNFYTTLLNTTTIDPTYVAAKAGAPDLLRAVVCMHRELWPLGYKTSEVWADAGSPTFPFQAIPGAFINHGLAATYSIGTHDNAAYFVGQDSEGHGYVVEAANYTFRKISTPAIDQALSRYPSLADAIGFCWQQKGHVYYQVSFPSANKTWVVDITSRNNPLDYSPLSWMERTWTDGEGQEQRHRAAFGAFAYDMNLCIDWENGMLYSQEGEQYNDFGGPIVRRRGFPHAVAAGRQAVFNQFQAEMDVGEAEAGESPVVNLRYSNTRGKSWSDPLPQSLGLTGEYEVVPQWRQLGKARDMVFELFWSHDTFTALNGAYVNLEPTDG